MAKPPAAYPQEAIAVARERFLADELPADARTPPVREVILESWERARSHQIAPDQIQPFHDKAADLWPKLVHSAAPIVREFSESLGDAPMSVILTDERGVVLERATSNSALRNRLDQVYLAPGFSYSEESVGTNGIGTALEGREPAQVFGHEHYSERLQELACAGVPIRNPVTGKLEGVVDVTCWRSEAGPMMASLAQTVAGRINAAMWDNSGVRETALLREYLRTSRRTTNGVIGVSNDVIMLNNTARKLLEPADETAVLGAIAEAGPLAKPVTLDVVLPSGSAARLACRPAWCEAGVAGSIVQVQITTPAALSISGLSPDRRLLLPGIVGSGPLWERCCHDVDRSFREREWLALDGESGVGKLALARAVQQRHSPQEHLRVLECPREMNPTIWLSELRAELDNRAGTLILRHVSCLDAATAEAAAAILGEYRPGEGPWVVATLDSTTSDGPDAEALAEVLRRFPRSVQVPPLRHHLEDMRELVPFLLVRLTHGDALTCSTEALRLLMRAEWPGNVRQLVDVLRDVCMRRRSGALGPEDLPPSCRATARRVLTPLEAMQRDAIVRALIDAAGSKAAAAQALGMSRATIYRKIHEYGITTP